MATQPKAEGDVRAYLASLSPDDKVYCRAMSCHVTAHHCRDECVGTRFAELRCSGLGRGEKREGRRCLECGAEIGSAEGTGYCQKHRKIYLAQDKRRCCLCGDILRKPPSKGRGWFCDICKDKLKENIGQHTICIYPGCSRPVTGNGIPLCEKHGALTAQRTCSYPGCEDVLDERNETGRCRRHRFVKLTIQPTQAELALAASGRVLTALKSISVRLAAEGRPLAPGMFDDLRGALYESADLVAPELTTAQRTRIMGVVYGEMG